MRTAAIRAVLTGAALPHSAAMVDGDLAGVRRTMAMASRSRADSSGSPSKAF
jgi:hypothetical protein